ncbi:ATPase [Aureococcus anophagefferens]|nr:ATPase [Aureococcus anophagefferens]
MDAAKAKELKKYTRELLRDHETLSRNLAAAEALAAERQAELDKLQAQAERAPEAGGNNYLFGELCRVKERAQQSEVEARRLSVKLDVAKDLRAVGARARSPRPSRASGAAALDGEPVTAPGSGGGAAESANRRVDDERRRLLEALEAAADAARRAHRGAAYRNGDGAALLVEAVEAARHRVARSDGGFGPFLLDAARACARLEERREAQDAVLVACAKAKDAAVAPWLETIGWGRGRLVLLELLNRSVLGFALRCLCAAGVAFQLRHARHAVERLRDAATPAAAAAEAPEVDDEAASTATGPSRVADRGPASVRSAHGPVAHGVGRRAAAGGVAVTARARGAAALRREDGRGAQRRPRVAVVVLQWQSRSRKLAWPSRRRRRQLALPAVVAVAAGVAPRGGGRRRRQLRGRRRGARGATAAAGRGLGRYAPRARGLGAADAVAGADRALGPVRERWAVVRGDAAVFLTCRLKRQRRPLLRRGPRFSVAAMDARRFHDVALAKAAATANAAGWALAELRDDPPDDAASHAAARQLADAAAFGDLEDAVRRVFGDDGAPHFVF